MKIVIVCNSVLPVTLYGGTERVVWCLGKELVKLGHKVTFLLKIGSTCDFAKVIFIDPQQPIVSQIPQDADVVHFNFTPERLEEVKIPYLVTIQGNSNDKQLLDKNTVFVSRNHALRHGSTSFVYNGLDWSDYGKVNFNQQRIHCHFLANAAWRVKNVKGAIDVIKKTKNEHLAVLGGVRFNFKMGLRFTFSPRASFYGMVGGARKNQLLNLSKALIFPVLWHEPFGLAIIESLYFGCPVFATPYGSLPELVPDSCGILSNKCQDLAEALSNVDVFSQKHCHEYVVENFNSLKMTMQYYSLYEKVISGLALNPQAPQLVEIQKTKFLPWLR